MTMASEESQLQAQALQMQPVEPLPAPRDLREWYEWRDKLHTQWQAEQKTRDSQQMDEGGRIESAQAPEKELEKLNISQSDPPDASLPTVQATTSPKFDLSSLTNVENSGKISEMMWQRFHTRDKEMQTKDGRAKWEAYEKRWNCVGYFEARKKQAIESMLDEGIDFDALLKLSQEAKAKEEANSANKTPISGSKGKKGKK